jgi:hypothetical protein
MLRVVGLIHLINEFKNQLNSLYPRWKRGGIGGLKIYFLRNLN